MDNIVDKIVTVVITSLVSGVLSFAALLVKFGGQLAEMRELCKDVEALHIRVHAAEKELAAGRAMFSETCTHIKYIREMIDEIKMGNASTNARLDAILGDAGKRRGSVLTESDIKNIILKQSGGA